MDRTLGKWIVHQVNGSYIMEMDRTPRKWVHFYSGSSDDHLQNCSWGPLCSWTSCVFWVSPFVFVLPPWNLCNFCFITVLWQMVFSRGFSPSCSLFLLCVLLFSSRSYGFSEEELRVVPRFLIYLANVVTLCLACAWWFGYFRACKSSSSFLSSSARSR